MVLTDCTITDHPAISIIAFFVAILFQLCVCPTFSSDSNSKVRRRWYDKRKCYCGMHKAACLALVRSLTHRGCLLIRSYHQTGLRARVTRRPSYRFVAFFLACFSSRSRSFCSFARSFFSFSMLVLKPLRCFFSRSRSLLLAMPRDCAHTRVDVSVRTYNIQNCSVAGTLAAAA